VNPGRSRFFTVRAIMNHGSYSIRGVEPGTYHLLLSGRADSVHLQHFNGAYTKAVACGLASGCNDHAPVPVTVRAGQAITGIAVTDFYAAANAYPLVPKGGPTETPLPSPSRSYPDALAAARYEAEHGTGAPKIVQGAFDQCPSNDAWVASRISMMGPGRRSSIVNLDRIVRSQPSASTSSRMPPAGTP